MLSPKCLANASCMKHYLCQLQADLDEALPCTTATSLKINSRVQSVVLPNLRTIQNTFSACDASPACLENPSLPACCDSASPAVGALPFGGLLQTQEFRPTERAACRPSAVRPATI